jgi:hypothetical protein
MDVHHTSNKLARRVCAGFGWSGSICISCTRSIPAFRSTNRSARCASCAMTGRFASSGSQTLISSSCNEPNGSWKLPRCKTITTSETARAKPSWSIARPTASRSLPIFRSTAAICIRSRRYVRSRARTARAFGRSGWPGCCIGRRRCCRYRGRRRSNTSRRNMASASLSLSPEEFRLLDDLDAAQTR